MLSTVHNYTRPEFTGTLAIKAGRHPVLENIQAAGNFVPNDTYACDGSSFQIVEGPNMSGTFMISQDLQSFIGMMLCRKEHVSEASRDAGRPSHVRMFVSIYL